MSACDWLSVNVTKPDWLDNLLSWRGHNLENKCTVHAPTTPHKREGHSVVLSNCVWIIWCSSQLEEPAESVIEVVNAADSGKPEAPAVQRFFQVCCLWRIQTQSYRKLCWSKIWFQEVGLRAVTSHSLETNHGPIFNFHFRWAYEQSHHIVWKPILYPTSTSIM